MMPILLALAVLGCDSAPGAVRLHAPGVSGELVIDGDARGPVQAEQTIELAPGRHRIAIVDGMRERVASEVEVRSRMIANVTIDPAQLDAPDPTVGAPPPDVQRVLDEQIARPERAIEADAPQEAQATPEDEADRRRALSAALSAALRRLRETCGAGVRAPARIDLELHVRANGQVHRVEASGDAPPRLVACVRREARRWAVPVDDDTTIRLPVVFSGVTAP